MNAMSQNGELVAKAQFESGLGKTVGCGALP